MRRIEHQRVSDLVMRNGVEIVGLVPEVAGDQPIVVVGDQEPPERVVVAKNFSLEAAGTFDGQCHIVAALHRAAETPLASGTMDGVGGAVGVELVTAVAVRVLEKIPATEVIRPDEGALRSDPDEVEIHAGKKVRPIIRRLFHQRPARRIREKARDVPVEVDRHRKIIRALQILVDDVNRQGVRLLHTVGTRENDRERVILIEAVAVRKNREPHRLPGRGSRQRHRFARPAGACASRRFKIEPHAIGP